MKISWLLRWYAALSALSDPSFKSSEKQHPATDTVSISLAGAMYLAALSQEIH